MKQPWNETQATILASRYQFARLNTRTLGIQTQKKFRISYDFSIDGELYTGEFQSPKALLQGEQISVRYNPLNPGENSLSNQPPAPETSLFIIILALFILFCAAWFILHHGHR